MNGYLRQDQRTSFDSSYSHKKFLPNKALKEKLVSIIEDSTDITSLKRDLLLCIKHETSEALVPQGYVVVPGYITDEMYEMYEKFYNNIKPGKSRKVAFKIALHTLLTVLALSSKE